MKKLLAILLAALMLMSVVGCAKKAEEAAPEKAQGKVFNIYAWNEEFKGFFDAYSWQLLETKQRFISGLLSGSWTERSGADIEDTVLDYAEVKALAVGNPLVKQRVEAANELTRYMTLQRKLVESRIKLEKELLGIPGQIQNQIDLIEYCKRDLAFYTEWRKVSECCKADN